jgi:TPP-dependent pyruvate/acetoin dehydrogenase alpha subunit
VAPLTEADARRVAAEKRVTRELEAWRARDPIEILAARLIEEGALSEVDRRVIQEQVQAEVDDAAARAATAPYPTLEETRPYVYAG